MTTETNLPKKLSDLLEVAMADLVKCEKSDDYSINMWQWHERNSEDGPCYVCLAGATMAQSLNAKLDDQMYPSSFSEFNRMRLSALNHLREGDVAFAINQLDPNALWQHDLDRFIIEYRMWPWYFKRQMKKLVKDLRKEGM